MSSHYAYCSVIYIWRTILGVIHNSIWRVISSLNCCKKFWSSCVSESFNHASVIRQKGVFKLFDFINNSLLQAQAPPHLFPQADSQASALSSQSLAFGQHHQHFLRTWWKCTLSSASQTYWIRISRVKAGHVSFNKPSSDLNAH